MVRITTTFATLVAAGALAASCGGGDDDESNADRFEGEEKRVAAVVDDLQAAAREGDVAAICRRIFTPAQAARVARDGGTTCEAKAREEIAIPEETITVQGLIVTGMRATAGVKEQTGKVSTLAFVKRNGDWRLDRIR